MWLRKSSGASDSAMERVRIWGYFVAPSEHNQRGDAWVTNNLKDIRCLWVGRLLDWKCVDTIVRAVRECDIQRRHNPQLPKVTLDIYGAGPEELRLRKMADEHAECIRFFSPIPMDEVRILMKGHDVYVLSSNACEGWGAVVNEAIEEGMGVVGTYEAGACRSMLPTENLFHAGNWKSLKRLLLNPVRRIGIGTWSVVCAGSELHMLSNWGQRK